MKRFAYKVGRFFWSRSFLKFVLWTITLIVFFYVEEDWRGARAWAATKAKWEARGETLDIEKLIPPPVPDDQNLGAVALFEMKQTTTNGQTELLPVALNAAMERIQSVNPDSIAATGWYRGGLYDPAQLSSWVHAQSGAGFNTAAASRDPISQLNVLFPFLSELRTAALLRPYCHFFYDNSQAFPSARPMPLVTAQIRLSRILTLHATLALNQRQTDLALADFETISKLSSGAKKDPSLIGGLVGIGTSTIGNGIVYDGLALHLWNDSQLGHIDALLKPLDFIAAYQFTIRCEAIESVRDIDYFRDAGRSLLGSVAISSPSSPVASNFLARSLLKTYLFLNAHGRGVFSFWPDGWFDQNKSALVESAIREMGSIDDQKRLVHPKIGDELAHLSEDNQRSWRGLVPWNVLGTVLETAQWKESIKFACAQVRTDEIRIACALERYRFSHKDYPTSLESLVPDEIADLPRDVMTGLPYHYQNQSHGAFLLYSVGWNQTDEGGTTEYASGKSNGPNLPDIAYEKGDWVWPTPKPAPNP